MLDNESEAIVKHREANSNIKTIDDVKKAPGLVQIESKKGQLEY